MNSKTFLTALLAALAFTLAAPSAKAQSEPFLGEIKMVGFTFCPRGWAHADGNLLPIAQYSALFSLYGTTYGGDGRTTFALPDLRGRVPMHFGEAAGLSARRQGDRSGQESVTLTRAHMPAHNHQINTTNKARNAPDPKGALLVKLPKKNDIYSTTGPANGQMRQDMVTVEGGGQPVNNMQPFLVVRFCVAVTGIFPSRS